MDLPVGRMTACLPTGSDAMSDQTKMLLAVGILEYQSAQDHLKALRLAGVPISLGALTRLRVEQRLLSIRWRRQYGDGGAVVGEGVVEDVRQYVTENIALLDRVTAAIDNHTQDGG